MQGIVIAQMIIASGSVFSTVFSCIFTIYYCGLLKFDKVIVKTKEDQTLW